MRAPRRTSEPGPRYLTTRQAASRLGVTVNAIKAWIREERLPALRTPGGHHRIAEGALAVFEAHLAESSRLPTAVQPRILMAAEDPALLVALKDAIGQVLPDVLVTTVTDGYDALLEIGAFRPDVLVLDLRLPRLDGVETCRWLKARRETAGLRILAVTTSSDGSARERLLGAGADDVLEKPCPIEKLRSRVMSLLEPRRPS
jgi:excisionase family DNA binding protein